MSGPKTDVVLLVLNWNGADLLARHLPAVTAAAQASERTTRVVVIDNASADDSRAVVARFEGVEWLQRPDNLKLHAYNKVVPELDCTAVMLLNNDLSPPLGAVDALWDVLAADDATFAVGGGVVDVSSGELESGPTGARWDRGWELEARGLGDVREPTDVAYVSGGFALVRRDMFVALGGFWDGLPALYWEDVELGLRAWLHGWRSVYHPGVQADHESGATVRRAVSDRQLKVGFYRNNRLTHLALVLDPADLRDYLRGELRRMRERPYLVVAPLTLLPQLRAAVRRRRTLRRRCGTVPVAALQARWYPPAAP